MVLSQTLIGKSKAKFVYNKNDYGGTKSRVVVNTGKTIPTFPTLTTL